MPAKPRTIASVQGGGRHSNHCATVNLLRSKLLRHSTFSMAGSFGKARLSGGHVWKMQNSAKHRAIFLRPQAAMSWRSKHLTKISSKRRLSSAIIIGEQSNVPTKPEHFDGKKSPVRMILLIVFVMKSYRPRGPKKNDMPSSRYWYEDLTSQCQAPQLTVSTKTQLQAKKLQL